MKILSTTRIWLLFVLLVSIETLWASDGKKTVTLTFHTYLGVNAPPTKDLILPWIKEVEKVSKGELKIEFYPSMSLGGKPSELYTQSKYGTADIVLTIAGYTPGVFLRTEALELPEIHTNSSLKTSIAAYENYSLIKDDYKKVKPLLIALAGPYQLHTTKKKVTKLKDLSGLKLRAPSRTGAWYIEELGAEPVGMPLPAIPQAIGKNAIDGTLSPFEIFPAFKFQDFTNYSTQIKGGGGFGGAVVLILMNKESYNNLPSNLKKVIDETTGMPLIKKLAASATKFDTIGKNLQLKSGGEVITLSDEETKKFKKIAHKVTQKWIRDVKKKSIDGKKIVDALKSSMENESN